MTDNRKFLIGVVIGAIVLTGCDTSESKGIERIPAFAPTTTSSTINPYRKPPSEPSRTPDPKLGTTRTTLSYDQDNCSDSDTGDSEPDVFEEFC